MFPGFHLLFFNFYLLSFSFYLNTRGGRLLRLVYQSVFC